MKIMTRILFVALLLAALPLAAQTHDWSQTGSTGQVGSADLFDVSYSGPTLKFLGPLTGTAVARYVVTNTYGSGTSKTPGWTTLWSTYTDNSANGSVTTKLFQVDKCSGTETQLCSITSSDAVGAQCSSCTFSSSAFDFANFTYYVEVTLARSVSNAPEEIHSVAVN